MLCLTPIKMQDTKDPKFSYLKMVIFSRGTLNTKHMQCQINKMCCLSKSLGKLYSLVRSPVAVFKSGIFHNSPD